MMIHPSREDAASEALQIRFAEQNALREYSFMVAALQGGGPPEARREMVIRQSIYLKLRTMYRDHCREHGLCMACNGDGLWENSPGQIGPCTACGGTGRQEE